MSIEARRDWRWWLIALLVGLFGACPAFAAVTLTEAEIAISASPTMPRTGWETHLLPSPSLAPEARRRGIDPPTIWVRLHFDRGALPAGPLALTAITIRERFTVLLNGTPIYRSDRDADSGDFGWHRPLYTELPVALLRDGRNDLALRVETPGRRPLMVGALSIGARQTMLTAHNRQTWLDVTVPEIINGILAILSTGLLLCWLARPRERVFGALALIGGVWWFRNLHYYVSEVPIPTWLFWTATTDSIFILLAVTYNFAATFFEIRHRRTMILAISTACALAAVARHLLVAAGQSDTLSFMMTVPVVVATLYVLGRECWRAPKAESLLMFGAVTLATAAAFHDLAAAKLVSAGAGFFFQPFGSLLVFSAFGFALGRRVLGALGVVENINVNLQAGIAEATRSLAISEAARRALEVAAAVEHERERMMREIHDGIGSSLITALAVAEKQHAPPSTIATLRRSIADLRIAVDSLEPIDGDVVMLLASLRYRMERDLREVGMAFVWKVEPSPPLQWLDAIGALHILRILQEAIGNTLVHAAAQLIEVGCRAASDSGRHGVLIVIADDGRGFEIGRQRRGRGLANMKARSEALGGILKFSSIAGTGSRVSLWLPLAK